MATTHQNSVRIVNHPLHIVLLVSTLPLFIGALLSDWAYSVSHEIQWINFASWLIVGALLFLGAALLWTVIDALRADRPHNRGKWIFVGLVVATFIVGFINALVHAKDAWAAMPAGLVLSFIVLVLAIFSIWAGFTRPFAGERK
ncbi:DUF2231 domain-containing protein [Sphingorhabdus sp.]|uniref:DUF2231 domain-containing protein n=1 Tax=Sphingorhabdus sp. TaxID=1902408 RepID=UPI00391CA607